MVRLKKKTTQAQIWKNIQRESKSKDYSKTEFVVLGNSQTSWKNIAFFWSGQRLTFYHEESSGTSMMHRNLMAHNSFSLQKCVIYNHTNTSTRKYVVLCILNFGTANMQ